VVACSILARSSGDFGIVRPSASAILIFITRSHFVRSSPMTGALRERPQGLPRSPDQEGVVFPEREPLVLTRALSRLAERLGIKALTFHDLRHDAASTLAMAGVPLRTIVEILGHRDMRMTIRYAHLGPQRLREAMHTLDAPPEARVVRYGRPNPEPNARQFDASPRAAGPPAARTWAALLRRVFALGVLAGPRWGGRLRVIATVQDPLAVQALLASLARSGAPAPPGPAPPAPAALG